MTLDTFLWDSYRGQILNHPSKLAGKVRLCKIVDERFVPPKILLSFSEDTLLIQILEFLPWMCQTLCHFAREVICLLTLVYLQFQGKWELSREGSSQFGESIAGI